MLVFIIIACTQQDCMLPMGRKITNPIIMIYHIRRIIGGVFNLAVWRIIFNPPNLKNAVSGL